MGIKWNDIGVFICIKPIKSTSKNNFNYYLVCIGAWFADFDLDATMVTTMSITTFGPGITQEAISTFIHSSTASHVLSHPQYTIFTHPSPVSV